MEINEFIRNVGIHWKPVRRDAEPIYSSKLNRYDNQERGLIFDYLIENQRFFPKVADIIRASKELGLEKMEVKSDRPFDTWEESDCQLCGGRGVVSVLKLLRGEEVSPVTAGPVGTTWKRVTYQPEMYEALNRCECAASYRESMPVGLRALPVYDREDMPMEFAA